MKKRDFIIYRNEASYCAFPWLTRLNEKKWSVVFREAPIHPGNPTHIDPRSHPSFLVSDDPLDWKDAKHFEMVEFHGGGQFPSLSPLGDGTFFFLDYRWEIAPDVFDRVMMEGKRVVDYSKFGSIHSARVEWDGNMFQISGLKSISAPSFTEMSGSGGLIEDGMGGHFFAVDSMLPNGDFVCVLLQTPDKGETMRAQGVLALCELSVKDRLVEPSVARVNDNELFCLFRSVRTDGHLWVGRSEDNGRTWTRPERTGIWGHPANVVRVDEKRFLAVYGYRREPYGIRAAISEDEGRTWLVEDELTLRDDGAGEDLGYPCVMKLDNGSFLCVYYFCDKDESRHIAATHFTL